MMDVTVETSTPCLFSNPSLSIYQMYVLEVDELASTVRTPHSTLNVFWQFELN